MKNVIRALIALFIFTVSAAVSAVGQTLLITHTSPGSINIGANGYIPPPATTSIIATFDLVITPTGNVSIGAPYSGLAGFSTSSAVLYIDGVAHPEIVPNLGYLATVPETLGSYNLVSGQSLGILIQFAFFVTDRNHEYGVRFDNLGYSSSSGTSMQYLTGPEWSVGSTSPIPEPSTYAAIIGAAVLLGAFMKRRKSLRPDSVSCSD